MPRRMCFAFAPHHSLTTTYNSTTTPMYCSTSLVLSSAPLTIDSTETFDEQKARAQCLEVFEVPAKPEQLEVVSALARRQDCILIAGCGWGKTLVYFLPLVLWPDRVILVLSPLKALAEEQQQKLEIVNIRSIAIKGETVITQEILNSLGEGRYRAVFLSPELIFSSDRIKNLWRQPGWRKRLFAIVVDEAHCIDSWGGSFRQEYGRIGELRSMVPRETPFLATSATLPPQVLENIKKRLHFRPDTHIVNVGNDRPNIKFIVIEFQYPMNSFQDLKFLMDFKKTIVYFNTRPDAERARRYLLQELCLDSNKIAVYHSIKSEKLKADVLERFRKDKVLILLATEAVGMGCDINNIARVVQYGIPQSLASLIQRLGRAARDSKLQGIGLTIVPHNPSRAVKDTADKDLHAFLYTETCRREVLDGIFGNKKREKEDEKVTTNCCDNCHPKKKSVEIVCTNTEVYQDVEAKAAAKRVPRRTDEEKAVAKQAIESWRKAVWERDFSSRTFFFPTPQYVMSDQVLQALADKHAKVVAADSINSFLNWSPPKSEYIQELTAILMDINKTITDRQGEKSSSLKYRDCTPSRSTNQPLTPSPRMPPPPKKPRLHQDKFSFIYNTPPPPFAVSIVQFALPPNQVQSPPQQPFINPTDSNSHSPTPTKSSTLPLATPLPTTLTPPSLQRKSRLPRSGFTFADRNNWTAAKYLGGQGSSSK
ncbi:P-loop containing nucleoside triphosphate hydrolase protein [Linnemannia elongata]|nr:P-loop containing nucleoside triphosphate hydrolase protein [Linnemannia elongata]